MSKLWWLYVDQMRVEGTATLSIGGCWTKDAEKDRSSVVLGKGLSTRDGKVVKVSAKKNTCIRTDQKSCEKSCEGTEMAKCFAIVAFQQYTSLQDL